MNVLVALRRGQPMAAHLSIHPFIHPSSNPFFMRVATSAYTDAMLNQYNLLASKQYNLQNQVSTGLRVQSPSDDPVAMQNTLDYAADKAAQTQYGANISTRSEEHTSEL